MRARTALLVAAAVPGTVAAAAAVLKAGHWNLHADRHRIHLTPVARRSCPDCLGLGGWWVGGPLDRPARAPRPGSAWPDEPPF